MSDWRVDGRPGAAVSPQDRGLLYGDGLFETVAFHHGRAALWPLHIERLTRGCAALALPEPDEAALIDDCRRLVGDRARAVIRITWTRGAGGAGYLPDEQPTPTRIVTRRDLPAALDRMRREGLDLCTSPHVLDTPPAALAGLKHLGRLPQVLIAAECRTRGVDEALVSDAHGALVEALNGNLVVVRDGTLIAPGPHPAAVAGVGLEWLRRVAGSALAERRMRRDELEPDDAMWVINSIRGPCPVRSLDGRELKHDSVIGPMQARWHEEVENPCADC